jgi:hypothetical protein
MNLEAILDPDETVIWRGWPRYVAYVLSFAPVMMIGVFWSSFVGMAYWGVLTQHEVPFVAQLILLPHALVSLGLLLSPLLMSLAYPNLEYMLTSKRVITRSGLLSRTVEAIDYTELSDVSVRVGIVGRGTATGDVRFVAGTGLKNPNSSRGAPLRMTPGFAADLTAVRGGQPPSSSIRFWRVDRGEWTRSGAGSHVAELREEPARHAER